MKTALQIIGLTGVITALLVLGIGVGVMHMDSAARGGIVLFLVSAFIKSVGHGMRSSPQQPPKKQ